MTAVRYVYENGKKVSEIHFESSESIMMNYIVNDCKWKQKRVFDNVKRTLTLIEKMTREDSLGVHHYVYETVIQM